MVSSEPSYVFKIIFMNNEIVEYRYDAVATFLTSPLSPPSKRGIRPINSSFEGGI
jgi:hypothetical protein